MRGCADLEYDRTERAEKLGKAVEWLLGEEYRKEPLGRSVIEFARDVGKPMGEERSRVVECCGVVSTPASLALASVCKTKGHRLHDYKWLKLIYC